MPEARQRLCHLVRTRLPLAAALAVFLGHGIATAQTAQKKQLEDVRGRIEALQKELEKSEEARAEAADALRESESAISRINRRLYELGNDRRALGSELGRLQKQAADLEGRIEQEREALGRLVYRQYVAGQPESIRIILNGQDPNETARQLRYLGYISRARAGLIASLRQNLDNLNRLTESARRKTADIRSLEREESNAKRSLEAEKVERATVLSRVSNEISQQRNEISTLKRNEQRLTQLIERLAREAQRRKRSPRIVNKALPDGSANTSAFAKLKGKLRLPVIGELTNRFGLPREDGGLSWKGLFIAAKPGRDVKAIAPGKVVYADWLRGFGNLLILDHGDGYMSLYGNNESLLKQAGEDIRGGETIAAVGNSGGNPDSGLYFEMRYQGRPFDPMPWVRLK